MCNPTRQCPDVLHPLGAEQFRCNPLSLSDVRVDYQNRLRFASFVAKQRPAAFHDNALTRFANLG